MFGNRKLGTVCFYVSDINRTETFYRDTLGLAVERMQDDGEGGDWLYAKTANEIEMVFFEMESRPGNSPILVFSIDDGGIDDTVSALVEKGVTIVTPVSEAPGGWSAEFADPDGHVLSMYQADGLPRTLR